MHKKPILHTSFGCFSITYGFAYPFMLQGILMSLKQLWSTVEVKSAKNSTNEVEVVDPCGLL